MTALNSSVTALVEGVHFGLPDDTPPQYKSPTNPWISSGQPLLHLFV